MIEFSVLGDRSVEDFLREIVGPNISADGNGIASKSSDFLNDKLCFLFIKAAETNVSTHFATGIG